VRGAASVRATVPLYASGVWHRTADRLDDLQHAYVSHLEGLHHQCAGRSPVLQPRVTREGSGVVKAFLDASIRRDMTQLAELVDPEVELHGTVGGVQEGQVYHGLAEVIREYDEVDGEAWEERRMEPVGFLHADDEVVVLFHEFRRGRGSGVELETDTAAVYTVRNGRVVRMQGFLDRAAARQAAGLSE
jgi:ketosteroid isomerase-like protein